MKGTYAKYFLMGLGYMGISVILSLYEADVPVMLEETFSLSNLATGLVINIDTFFAVAFMPIVTAYSDIVRTR
ncbi:MAG TPA: MFS transporter, partial [Coprothermobacter proteolyticus]|nr:MFS transporter [Coprothermobacter proteolyticus]